MAGSFYHMSKCNDINNMYLAHKQWGLPVSDVRVAIVTGATTDETKGKMATRFDFDFYFGVVTHRFCAQALIGYPITVYGKGLQGKPFVTAVEKLPEGFNISTLAGGESLSVLDIAKLVKNTPT